MDAIDMYFLNRIRPDSPLMPRVVFPPLLERQRARLIRAATLLQIYLGECLLGALSAHATRADECPLHRADLPPCDADTLGRPERNEPFVTG